MGRFVIVAGTPRAGREQVLQAEKLVTDRPAHVLRGADGTVVEVWGWRSAAAIETAPANPAVPALWAELGAPCEYTPLARLAEAQQMFAEFDAVER